MLTVGVQEQVQFSPFTAREQQIVIMTAGKLGVVNVHFSLGTDIFAIPVDGKGLTAWFSNRAN